MDRWRPPERLPRHIAIIMDGNGRWAKQRGLPRALGHRKGVEALRAIVRESSDLGIEVLSLYAFSTENWKRSTEEVGVLMRLMLEFFRSEIDELHENRVRIRILGAVDGLPDAQRKIATEAMDRTRGNSGLQLNIAINYGGRDELVRAFRRMMNDVQTGKLSSDALDEDAVARYLDTAGQPDVDLLLRTSAEQRLSNFLLYQSAYAEFLFPPTYWPDFDLRAYHEALDTYASRDRRFGARHDEGE